MNWDMILEENDSVYSCSTRFSLSLPTQLQEGKELQLEWLGFHWDVFENAFSIPASYLRRAVILCLEALCACPALSYSSSGVF